MTRPTRTNLLWTTFFVSLLLSGCTEEGAQTPQPATDTNVEADTALPVDAADPKEDTAVLDTAEPDSSAPEDVIPDAEVPDAAAPPDITEPDAVEPDAVEPDTSKPDTNEEPDTADDVAAPKDFGGVVINEVLYDNVGGDTATWLELYGKPGTSLDGLEVVGISGTKGTKTGTLVVEGSIGADGFFLIVHPEAPAALATLGDLQSEEVDFQNGPDSIQLTYAGEVLDALAYGTFGEGEVAAGEGTPAALAAAGESLGRKTDGADTDDNATDFVVMSAPSPGQPNKAANPTWVSPHGLLLSEVAVTPNGAEFVEIANPTTKAIDLTHVWLADYAEYHTVSQGGAGPAKDSDWRVKLPDGGSLAPGGRLVVSMGTAAAFESTYGASPDYTLGDLEGDVGVTASLSNSDEMVVLFTWNPAETIVHDVDYILWGDASDAMDKSAVSGYSAETPAADQKPALPPGAGQSLSRCDFTEGDEAGGAGNGLKLEDETSENLAATWAIAAPSPGAEEGCPTGGPIAVEKIEVATPFVKWLPLEPTIVQTKGDFESLFGVPVPAGLDLTTKNLVYVPHGVAHFPALTANIDAVELQASVIEVAATRTTLGDECTFYVWSPVIFDVLAYDVAVGTANLVKLSYTDVTKPCVAGGAGMDCSFTEPCPIGSICSNLTVWSAGFCQEAALTNTYDGPKGTIPDGDPAGVELVVNVDDLATVPMDAILDVALTHPDPSELTIKLSVPKQYDGSITAELTVWDQGLVMTPGSLQVSIPVKGVPGDESVNGEWTLIVIDNVAGGGSGTVDGWVLELTSRWD